MAYPPLTISWANPTPHERRLYVARLREIFYFRVFIYVTVLVALLVHGFVKDLFVPALLWLLIGFAIFPLLVRPWDVILSNKRLILRSRYWNVGRFSTQINFNLSHLDTQSITPRIKVVPLVLGVSSLINYSMPLIEFSLTTRIPTPLYAKLYFLLVGPLGFVTSIKSDIDALVVLVFGPFTEYALAVGLVSGLLSLILIAIGLPHRSAMELMTTGGHRLFLNTGFPDDLSKMLYSIGRKHKIKIDKNWDWELPLLEGEKIKEKAKVGLINRKSQFLSLLSLILVLESFDSLTNMIVTPSITTFVVLLLDSFNILLLLFTINFAKQYKQLVATNHRILFREERKIISGIYGKRIYRYQDLPFENIQGFSYSSFSGFGNSGVVVIIILYIHGFFITVLSQSIFTGIISIVFLLLYASFDYRTFTNLRISSYSGNVIEFKYRLPFIMNRLSHRLENKDWLYNKIFPNILAENEIAGIGNAIRGVMHPLINVVDENIHEISHEIFVEKGDKELARWEKIAPYRFAKQSIMVTVVVSMVILVSVGRKIAIPHYRFAFFLIVGIILLMRSLRLLILVYNSLILYRGRLFRVEQTLPVKIALLFGVLPYRNLSELNLEHLVVSSHQNRITAVPMQVLQSGLISALTLVFMLRFQLFPDSSQFLIYPTLLLMSIIFFNIFPEFVRSLFSLIPRYSLSLYSKFDVIILPNMENINNFSQYLKEARA